MKATIINKENERKQIKLIDYHFVSDANTSFKAK
jgi:hypothetical protein